MRVESVVEVATRYIEELIITGKLRPGEQIKEEDIATKLEISRPPIREALNCLEGEGIVVRKPRKGAFVLRMTQRDVKEIYTLKATLYSMATELAIDVITDKEIKELKGLAQQMERITDTERGSILKYQKLHRRFHKKIMEIAGNQRLLKFASSLHKQIRRYSFQTLSFEGHLRDSSEYHNKIVAMIEAKDKENAHRIMSEHILHAMEFLLNAPGILSNKGDVDLTG